MKEKIQQQTEKRRDQMRELPGENICCPICGSKAELSVVSLKEGGRTEYKANCLKSALHVSCGDWYTSKAKAWADWAKRCTGYGQPEWHHPSNLTILKRKIDQAKTDKEFAETVKKVSGILSQQEDAEVYLQKRHDYGFCEGCSQFGNEYCICSKVSYQKVIDPKDSEVTQNA